MNMSEKSLNKHNQWKLIWREKLLKNSNIILGTYGIMTKGWLPCNWIPEEKDWGNGAEKMWTCINWKSSKFGERQLFKLKSSAKTKRG